MKKNIVFLLFLLFLSSKTVKGAELFSIEPYEIYPESEVVLRGAGFAKETVVILGDRTFKPFYLSENLIKFTVPPNTEPATYRLILRDEAGSTSPVSITVAKRDVVIYGFTPDFLDRCGETREISVTGKNLKEIKKINANGRDIPYSMQNNLLSLRIPDEIMNNAGNVINLYFYGNNDKIVHLLNVSINSKPIINNISVITNDFNSTTYRITGKNFLPDLILYVNNQVITENKDASPQQNITYLQRGYQRGANLPSPMLDRFQINSCREIIYTRYPATPDDKRIDILIESPNGERSNTYTITAP